MRLSQVTLYHFASCPYCIRVRSATQALGLDIAVKNTQEDGFARQELFDGGGKPQVPCLRIKSDDGKVSWMYESEDIIRWLEVEFCR